MVDCFAKDTIQGSVSRHQRALRWRLAHLLFTPLAELIECRIVDTGDAVVAELRDQVVIDDTLLPEYDILP